MLRTFLTTSLSSHRLAILLLAFDVFALTAISQDAASQDSEAFEVVLSAEIPGGASGTDPFEWTIIDASTEELHFPEGATQEAVLKLQPGSYEVIVISGSYSAERNIIVAPGGQNRFAIPMKSSGKAFAIDAPDKVSAGSPFTVAWRGPEGDRGYLFITSPMTADTRYQYGDNSLKASEGDSGTLVAPAKAGTYEIRYFSMESESLAARRPLLVTAPLVSVEFHPTAAAGSMIDFTWSGPEGPGDRIFIANKDMAANRYFTNEGVSFKVGSDQETSVIAPAVPGEYEIRYYSGRLGTPLGRFPVTVTEPEVTLEAPRVVTGGTKFDFSWAGPASKGDFLFYTESELPPSKFYRNDSRRHKIEEGQSGQFTAPTEPGNYEIRYYSYLNGMMLAKHVFVVR